jgi:hypothetical protein
MGKRKENMEQQFVEQELSQIMELTLRLEDELYALINSKSE